jgi:hypothetical protein
MLDQTAATAGVRGRRNPPSEPADSPLSPSLAIRVLARIRRWELDHALGDGADPAATPLLTARAAQLVSRGGRHRIAAALERMALMVDAERGPLRTLPSRDAVQANRAEILRLAATLRQGGRLNVRGIAVLELILIDGTGPAYTDPRGEGLGRQLRLAADSLSG